MSLLRFTLVGEGSSDAALQHPLRWLLAESGITRPFEVTRPDLRLWPRPLHGLADKIQAAVDLTEPCDLIFVHRDADREPPENRRIEIRHALDENAKEAGSRPFICVVPVRETEAWFLFDEAALRWAVNNPRGTEPLNMPALQRIEALPDAKHTFKELVRAATEKPTRRLRGFSEGATLHRLAELITDFAPLRQLSAFRRLEEDIQQIVRQQKWNG